MNKDIDAWEKEKYSKAVKLFSKSIKTDSNNFDSYLNRGVAFNDLGLYDKAFNDYKYLISKKYNSPDLYYNLGKNYYEVGKLDSSLIAYNIAISMDSTDMDYHICKGTTLTDLRYFDQAIIEYNKALIINPKDIITLKDLGYTYLEMGELELSKKYILDAIQNGLIESEYFQKLALISYKLGDQLTACKYEELARKHRKRERLLNLL